MANDPYRTLGLPPGATLDEVKRAYRGLAKRHHPDVTGQAATARFLAVQAAYEAIVGDHGAAGTTGGRPGAPDADAPTGGRPWARRPSQADRARAKATRDAYRRRDPTDGGTGRKASAPGSPPAGGGGGRADRTDPRSAAGRADGPADRPGRRASVRRKATLTSTTYDDALREPFEPDWDGGAWYGPTMGTYWTINPKEYADPRKHGAEYQARARRDAAGGGGGAEGVDEAVGDRSMPAGAPPPGPGPHEPVGTPSHGASSVRTPSDGAPPIPSSRPGTGPRDRLASLVRAVAARIPGR